MNEKFDEIMGRLAAQDPVLEDGEALTESIMESLPELPLQEDDSAKNAGNVQMLRIFLRTFASTAAVLLIIIYMCSGLDFGNGLVFSRENQPKNNYEQCIAKYKSDYSFLEGATDMREAGARYLAKKRSHESIINYLKNKHYEVH